ncbi:hypothetical protein ACIRPU_09660 [Streptomyces sp. NPDC102259]|uniref:hypothetical protein n=1 Tax=Streptomyces sp. NPDC102259 TaxID=3366148 RepID=UPI003808D1D6
MTTAPVGVSLRFTGDSHRLPVRAGHASMLTAAAALLVLMLLVLLALVVPVLLLVLVLLALPSLVLLPVPFVRRLGPRVG